MNTPHPLQNNTSDHDKNFDTSGARVSPNISTHLSTNSCCLVSFRGISIDSKLNKEANDVKLVLREERPRRADEESSASLSLLRLVATDVTALPQSTLENVELYFRRNLVTLLE